MSGRTACPSPVNSSAVRNKGREALLVVIVIVLCSEPRVGFHERVPVNSHQCEYTHPGPRPGSSNTTGHYYMGRGRVSIAASAEVAAMDTRGTHRRSDPNARRPVPANRTTDAPRPAASRHAGERTDAPRQRPHRRPRVRGVPPRPDRAPHARPRVRRVSPRPDRSPHARPRLRRVPVRNDRVDRRASAASPTSRHPRRCMPAFSPELRDSETANFSRDARPRIPLPSRPS